MKKLLVLALVLGMATMANAALLELRVGGNAVDMVSPGVISGITITNNEEITAGGGKEHYYILVTETMNTWDHSAVSLYSTDLTYDTAGLDELGVQHPAGQDGAFLAVFTLGSPYAANTVLFSGIKLTASGGTLSLYQMNDNDITQVEALVDRIQIIPIFPEPMTLALLGLGGLFLRRRK